MLARIQIRRDSKTNWDANNPILHSGEIGYETLTERFKIGDGISNWSALPYQLGHWDGQTNGDISFGYQSGEGNVKIRNNLQVDGNLFVNGTTTTVNTKEVTFNDRMLTLNWNEDPVRHYDSSLISGLDINIGWPDTAFAPAYSGVDFLSVSSYDSTNNQTVITLNNTLAGWPATYKQNYVIYFSPSEPFGDPDLAFYIKSYDSTTDELTVVGDASAVPNTKDFEIHNVIRQLYWKNDANTADAAWYVDGNKIWHEGNLNIAQYLPLSGGTLTGNLEISQTDTNPAILRLANTDTAVEANQVIGSIEFESADSTTGSTGVLGKIDVMCQDITPDAAMRFFTSQNDTGTQEFLERMRISNIGNVGINTNAPDTKLHIDSNTSIGNETLLRLERPNGYGNTGFNQYYNQAVGSDPVLWGLNFGLAVGTDTDGKVGIKFESTTGSTTTSDKIVFKTANTTKVLIDNSGNVGIGTTSPSSRLHIVGELNAGNDSKRVRINSTSSHGIIEFNSDTSGLVRSNTGDLRLQTDGANDRLTIDSSGKVGIGTTSPDELLHLEILTDGVNKGNPGIVLENSDQKWTIFNRGSSSNRFQINDMTDPNATTAPFRIFPGAPTDSIHISSNGNVGIGETTPAEKIEVSGAIKLGTTSSTNAGTIRWSGTDFEGYTGSAWESLTTPPSSGAWSASSNDIYYNSGKVGIGTTSPDTILEVVGADPILTIRDTDTSVSTVNAKLRLAETNASDTLGNHWDIEYLTSDLNFSYNGTPFMHIDYQGKVGIGTSSPQHNFSVYDGNEGIDFDINYGGGAWNRILSYDRTTSGVEHPIKIQGLKFTVDTNGTERFRVNDDGKVGIGTSSPEALLTLQLDTGIGFVIEDPLSERLHMLTRDGSGHGYYIGYADGETVGYKLNSSGDSYFVGGDVGIGTSSPGSKLDIAIGASNSRGLRVTSSNNAIVTGDHISVNALRGNTDAYNLLNLTNASGTKFIVQGDGNVGIGTSSPSKKLHVTDSNEIVATLTNSTNASATKTLLRFSQSSDSDLIAGTVGINRLGANAGCGFEINLADSSGNEQNRLTILEGGNAGIGASNPSEKLHVAGAIRLGTTSSTNTGTIRWSGSDFEGYDGSTWNSLTLGSSATQWTLTANGTSDYIFSGPGIHTANTDPDIFLVRGQTYRFDNQSGGHPFEIRYSPGGTAYPYGVSQSGTITTFTVPMNAPSLLYYQCTSHSSMLGNIYISSNELQQEWKTLGSTNYDASTSPQYDYKFYRVTDDITYDFNRVYEVIVDADDNSGMVAIYHLYLSSHGSSGNHDRIMMSHVSGRPYMMRVVLDSNEHVWIAATNKWGAIRIRGLHENEDVSSMPFADSQLSSISSPQFNETAQFIWNGDTNEITLLPTATLEGKLGIGTNDPKLKAQISGGAGALFIDGGGYNPDSTPPSGYYTSLSNDTNHSPGIVIGNEWAWDSANSNYTGGANWIKGHLHNYNGSGMRLSFNDGSMIYDHTANSWGSSRYDEPTHSAPSIEINRAVGDTESVFKVNIRRDSSNYAQSGTVFGDLLDVKHNGYTKILGSLNVGASYGNTFNLGVPGDIRYNSTTDDFEGNTTSSGWVSLTQKRVNLFLDTSIARTLAGNNTTWTWGPTGSGATHIVAGFTNFKNSAYASYDRLCFFGGSGYSEVVISDLLAINPTNSSRLYLGIDDQEQFDDAQYLYFNGNDLWLVNAIGNYGGYSNAIFKYYRIDVVA